MACFQIPTKYLFLFSKKARKVKQFRQQDNGAENVNDVDVMADKLLGDATPPKIYQDVNVYRHKLLRDVEAVVDPATLDLVGGQSSQLINLLNQTDMTIKALIETGVFRDFVEAKIK